MMIDDIDDDNSDIDNYDDGNITDLDIAVIENLCLFVKSLQLLIREVHHLAR